MPKKELNPWFLIVLFVFLGGVFGSIFCLEKLCETVQWNAQIEPMIIWGLLFTGSYMMMVIPCFFRVAYEWPALYNEYLTDAEYEQLRLKYLECKRKVKKL